MKRQKRDDLEIFYFIQTNGYTLDDRWARFFQENRFLVGVSLDGTIHTHDRWRKNIRGEGTFRRVMEGIDSLNRYRVPFNILTVVTGDVARTADKVYRFLRKQGFDHLQFIPCMDPLGGKEKSAYSLSGEEYGDFLCRIFDLWYDELCRGEQVWIRQFDNYVDMLSGYEPEACDMRGRCGKNYVIEADGSVYPVSYTHLDVYKRQALDWLGGNKTPYVDGSLLGGFYGVGLRTKPEELYRALIEATAFGTRRIVESMEESGTRIEKVVVSGGISKKNPFFMQIYAHFTCCFVSRKSAENTTSSKSSPATSR